ncbi:MAG: MBL fold metallo-hydrolase [bacterium]|nr:MBL fold metallo-hydrolase [bacterium]
MLFRQLFDSESSTYTYLLADPLSRESVLIDPVLNKTEDYLSLLEQLELRLAYAIDTHVHADHVTALGKLREDAGCVTVMGRETGADCVSQKISDGQELNFGDGRLRAIYTPGHTDDSYSFYDAAGGRVFTGDTLLIRGTGRTDFQNGDPFAQYASLFEKLLRLPAETLVYPAHDYRGWTVSTIAEERRWNPRLQAASAEDYAQIMNNLNLPNPKMMDVAVPANQRCGRPPA